MPHKGMIKAQKVERIATPIPITLGKNKEIIMIRHLHWSETN